MTPLLGALMLAALVAPAAAGSPSAFDHRKNIIVPTGIKWLEVGFFYIYQDKWVDVGATYTNFTDPVVFLSLPNLAGNLATNGTSMSLRVNATKLKYVSHNYKEFSFKARSWNVNDSFCVQWKFYTPEQLTLNASFVAWLAIERGMYNVSYKAFSINKDWINRTNSNDSTDFSNQRRSFAMTGCHHTVTGDCSLTSPAVDILSIAQLISTRFPKYLLLRGYFIAKRTVTYMLIPHDSTIEANYYIPTPGEDFAWMIFDKGMSIDCIENLVIESYQRQVTYLLTNLTYKHVFTNAPGVFGMVNSYVGRDSLGLRAFSITPVGNNFITQEDKCYDEETFHTTPERSSILIIGQTSSVGSVYCASVFNQAAPTMFPTLVPTTAVPSSFKPSSINPTTATPSSATPSSAKPSSFKPSSFTPSSAMPSSAKPSAVPVTASPTVSGFCADVTLYDTFGDGWGDIVLRVSGSETTTTDLTISCADGNIHGPVQFCTGINGDLHFDVLSLTNPAKSTWEVYYTVLWQGVRNEMHVGDFFTNMSATYTDFTVDNALALDGNGTNCHRCKHPPPPPPKGGAGGPGAGGPGAGGPGDGIGGPGAGGPGDGIGGPGDGGVGPGPRQLHNSSAPGDNAPGKSGPGAGAGGPGAGGPGAGAGAGGLGDGPGAGGPGDGPGAGGPGGDGAGAGGPGAGADGAGAGGPGAGGDGAGAGGPGAGGPGAGAGAGGPGAGGPGAGAGAGGPGAGGPGAGAGAGGLGDGPGAGGPGDGPGAGGPGDGPGAGGPGDGPGAGGAGAGAGGPGAGGPAKPKPPPPLWPFPITLWDLSQLGGWFNDSISWTQVPWYGPDGYVIWRPDRLMPPVLTGPEYIISTIDRVHDIRRGTICGDFEKEECEELLPDAKYIFRVTGALSKWDTTNTSEWRFCGEHGTSMQELEFTVRHGKCIPGAKVTAREVCYGALVASFSGLLTVSGVSSDALSDFDAVLLEKEIAEAISSVVPGLHSGITLNSWSLSGSNLVVPFSIKFDPKFLGTNGVQYDVMESLASQMQTAASTFVSSGSFMSVLKTGLLNLPSGSEDILVDVSSVTISDLTYVNTVLYAPSATSETIEATVVSQNMKIQSTPSALLSFEKSATILLVVFCGVVFAFIITRPRSSASAAKVEMSDHSSRVLLSEESTRPEDFSREMLPERIPNYA